jgi:hypothetical protein
MLARVSDQLEAERRAALAAGRRRLEQEVGQVLAGEQAALLAQQQVRLFGWEWAEKLRAGRSC